jgi:hypothetical protein
LNAIHEGKLIDRTNRAWEEIGRSIQKQIGCRQVDGQDEVQSNGKDTWILDNGGKGLLVGVAMNQENWTKQAHIKEIALRIGRF